MWKGRCCFCVIFFLLFRFALICDGGLRCGYRLGVAEVVVLYRLEFIVEFVDERHSGRDVQLYDVLLRYAVEVFDERSEAAMMMRFPARMSGAMTFSQ